LATGANKGIEFEVGTINFAGAVQLVADGTYG
jgi:hypothetical protein